MYEKSRCWIEGKIVPASEARVSVFDHGFLYGDGVFEGVRFYNQKPFRLPRHLKRLQQSATALTLRIPMTMEELEQAVTDTIAAMPTADGYLRIIITRGIGILGINPASCENPGVIIIADELQLVSDQLRNNGIQAIIASTRRSTPDRLDPRIKSLNYLNSIIARMEANHAGVDEAILLNERGFVAEGTAENIFIVKDGELLTPTTTEGALAGITRATVLELATKIKIPARETILSAYDLYTADECFLTGTGARLIPVKEIDGRVIRHCPGATYQQLSTVFLELVTNETE